MLRAATLRLATVLLGTALILSPVRAADYAPEHLAAARAAIAASNTTAAFDNILPNVAQQTKTLFIRTNPTLIRQLEETVTEVAIDFAKRRPELDREIQRVWASRFSREELEAIATFYNTEVGKKFAKEFQDMIGLSVKSAITWQDQLSTDMVTRVRDEMRKKGHAL